MFVDSAFYLSMSHKLHTSYLYVTRWDVHRIFDIFHMFSSDTIYLPHIHHSCIFTIPPGFHCSVEVCWHWILVLFHNLKQFIFIFAEHKDLFADVEIQNSRSSLLSLQGKSTVIPICDGPQLHELPAAIAFSHYYIACFPHPLHHSGPLSALGPGWPPPWRFPFLLGLQLYDPSQKHLAQSPSCISTLDTTGACGRRCVLTVSTSHAGWLYVCPMLTSGN